MAQMNSYFETVPDEIKVKIFLNLKTSDIISVCKAFPQLTYILCDLKILRSNGLNFYKSYQMTVQDIKNLSVYKSELINVTTLDISGLYWIPFADLVNFIKKLPNLVNLFAVGTKLNFSIFQNCELTKIKKIAITDEIRLSKISIILNSSSSNTLEFVLIQKENARDTRYLLIKNIMFCFTRNFINANEYMDIVHHKEKETNVPSFPQLLFPNNSPEFSTAPNIKWKLENILLLENNCPFGIRDIKAIFNKNYDINAILLEEIDLCHKNSIKAYEFIQYKYFLTRIVMYDNIKFLRKLALNFCSCKGNPFPKKRKLEVDDVSDDFDKTENFLVLENLVHNCPYLEELEIWKCDTHIEENDQSSLNYVAKLKKLKKLTLINVPLNIPNKFLLNVIKNCDHLEHLNVKSEKLNATLNNSMYFSLPYAASLKDLRYEQTYVSLDRFFESLNKIEDCQLQRLHIKCTSIERFEVNIFSRFLERCKHLVFLLLEIESLPHSAHKNIQKTLDKYKTKPQQIFYSTKFAANKNIPILHFLEFVKIEKKVSVLNYFENCNFFL